MDVFYEVTMYLCRQLLSTCIPNYIINRDTCVGS